MTIKIELGEVNYESIMESVIPMLKEKSQTSSKGSIRFGANILEMLGDIPVKFLSLIPRKKKDEILICFINNYKEKIRAQLQNSLKEKGIEIDINSIEILEQL